MSDWRVLMLRIVKIVIVWQATGMKSRDAVALIEAAILEHHVKGVAQ